MLFCGDPLAFISRHHIPACMHRPDGLEMAMQAPEKRLSTPFFLYADEEGVFDSGLCRADLEVSPAVRALVSSKNARAEPESALALSNPSDDAKYKQ